MTRSPEDVRRNLEALGVMNITVKKVPADIGRTHSNFDVLRNHMITENIDVPSKPINIDLTMK